MEVTSYLTTKVLSLAESWISGNILSRWSRHRAYNFLGTFLEALNLELSDGTESRELDLSLKKILKNETAEQVLFESYRKVCLSSSKELGPRIIGLLTGKIILEDREANEDEDRMFMLAEDLSDSEFIEFCAYHDENLNDDLEVQLREEYRDSNWKTTRTSISSLSVVYEVGLWAGKLERAGFLSMNTCVEEYDYGEDSERHVDEPGHVTKYTHSVMFDEAILEFYNLVRRAQGPCSA